MKKLIAIVDAGAGVVAVHAQINAATLLHKSPYIKVWRPLRWQTGGVTMA